jgi:hypothetical protein
MLGAGVGSAADGREGAKPVVSLAEGRSALSGCGAALVLADDGRACIAASESENDREAEKPGLDSA